MSHFLHPAVVRLFLAVMGSPDAFFLKVSPKYLARSGGANFHVHAVSKNPWRLQRESAEDWAKEMRN